MPDERKKVWDRRFHSPSLLGYLNFSSGTPDPRFQRNWNEAYAFIASQGVTAPWAELVQVLRHPPSQRIETSSAAFKDVGQSLTRP